MDDGDDDICYVLDKHAEVNLHSWWLTETTAHRQKDMSVHSDTLSCLRTNQNLILLVNVVG